MQTQQQYEAVTIDSANPNGETCVEVVGNDIDTQHYSVVFDAQYGCKYVQGVRDLTPQEHAAVLLCAAYALVDVPNLDAMAADDLMDFWMMHQRGRRYRALCPAGGVGTKNAVADLANYASNIATAKRCRARGDIVGAQMYEGIAQRIYDALPKWARW